MSESDPEYAPDFCSECGNELFGGTVLDGRVVCALCYYKAVSGVGGVS